VAWRGEARRGAAFYLFKIIMFQPKNEQPAWKMIYDQVKDLPAGELITNEQLSEMIDGDILKYRSAVYRARKELAKTHKRYLVSVRGVGYKVVEGLLQLSHAEHRHDSATRQIKMANFEAINIDTKKMPPEERQRWSEFMVWNGNALNAMSKQAEQVAKFQEVTSDMVSNQLATLKNQMAEYSSKMEDLQKKIE